MPGIVGIISQKPAVQCRARVSQMLEVLRHENFYETAMLCVPEMGVYAGGIALEKSFAENPVLFNEDRSIALIFSGECYFDAQTGAGLKIKGHDISQNKADWLPHLYEEQGEAFFSNLNGLFSGLLIDRRQRKAFLFNDRYGLSRIYFHESNGDFYFASEAKALLQILPELREFDENGVAEFFACGCPLDWKTIFRGVKILPGGSRWIFEDGNCHKEKYFSPDDWKNLPELSGEEFESQFQETFKRILPRYFETDGKLGIALTGGFDTRMILACRPELSARRAICYTFTGEKCLILDDEIAARVAAACSYEHELLRLTPEFFADFAAHVDRTVFLTDGCFGITGAHEIYLNHRARELAPTRLTGVFGGEILRGVSTFKPTGISRDLIDSKLHPQMDLAARRLLELKNNPVPFAAFCEVPWSLFGSMKASASQVNFRSPYLDNELVKLAHQTPKHLQKSAAPAVNLVKTNDPKLAAISTDMGGFDGVARRIYSKVTFKLDYICNDGLPNCLAPFDGILDRLASRGIIFGQHKFLRYRRWLRDELATYLKDSVAAIRKENSFVDTKILKQMAVSHLNGRKNFLREINAALTLDAVERNLFCNRRAPEQRMVETISKISRTTSEDQTIAGEFAGYKKEVLT